MSVELQLNAVNLTLVAFARMHNDLGGAGAGVLLDGGRRGRGRGRARRSSCRSTGDGARSTSTPPGRCGGRTLTPHAVGMLWLIPAIPLAGRALNLFFGNRLGEWAGVLATVAVGRSFAVALAAVLNLLPFASEDRLGLQHLFDWISVGGFNVGADLRLDTLSATMILVITGIGALIHLYSIGYMEHDPRRGRFFAYMNLFVFFMLMLVLGRQLPRAVPRVGGRRALLLPVDRLLVRQARERRGGEEGVHHHADRRHADADRPRAARVQVRHAGLRGDLRHGRVGRSRRTPRR